VTDAPPTKGELRAYLRGQLDALCGGRRAHAGEAVAAHLTPLLEQLRIARPGAPVALFASLPHELPTDALDALLIRLGIPRLLPSTEPAGTLAFRLLPADLPARALDPGVLGIPTPPADLPARGLEGCGLILVPGSAFDVHGGRLGWGKGYYDRALASLRARDPFPPPTVGIGFDVQRVQALPMDPHDQRVDALCTPERGIEWFR
jgi:5-formyltetrahydrofolate cyclo-ligase